MKKHLAFVLAAGLILCGTAIAQTPGGVHTGTSPQSGNALVTLSIPQVVGVNVTHDFVLNFKVGGCWGSSSTTGTFPQPVGGANYTFAVTTGPTTAGTNVTCPGLGSQSDFALMQVMSTVPAAQGTGRLSVAITDGAAGAQPTKFTDMIADMFTATRLQFTSNGAACGTGTTRTSPFNVLTAAADEVTGIPTEGWTACDHILHLVLAGATPVTAGTATGTLTFTITAP